MNKYRNKKTVVNGITFDSQKEAKRYGELMLLERAGEIFGLKTQVKFQLLPSQKGGIRTERPLSYVADFTYWQKDKPSMIIEDVKGKRTAEYVIKRKLMKQAGYEITEI